MRDNVQQERYATVWNHRLALGLDFSQANSSDHTWFWLNAYPALAALRSRIAWDHAIPGADAQPHPLVATCAGWADQVAPGLGPDEADANTEIAQRFFA